MTKLTNDQIISIYFEDAPVKDIAKKYRVSVATVRRIKNLEYKKYKEIIEEYKKKNNSEIIAQSTPQPAQQILPREITIEEFTNVLFSVLVKYIQPEIAKFLIDNYVLGNKTIELTNKLIAKINEVKTVDFYKEAIAMITNILLQKCFTPETFKKVFGEGDENTKLED